MKALCCTFFSCAIVFQAPAAEPIERRAPAPLPLPVTAECQMVVVSPKLALTLIPELSDDVKILTAWPRLQQMVGRGEATLSARLLGKGTTDKALTVQTIEEIRYPVLFEPPQLPESFFDTPAPTVREPTTLEVLKEWPAVASMPLDFETRETGQSMELSLSPTGNPKVVQCTYMVSSVRLKGMDKLKIGRLASGEQLTVEQPRFTALKDQSTTTLQSGEPKLIGVHRLPGPAGDYELFILKLTFTPDQAP